MEQTYRDQRLNMIHEGTNGIQSLDLLGRKMKTGLSVLLKRVRQDIVAAKKIDDSELSMRANALEMALERLQSTCTVLLGKMTDSQKLALANSHEFLNMTGHIIIGWMWLRQETAACLALEDCDEERKNFLRGKRLTSEYFFGHELPKTIAQAELLVSLNDTVLRMDNGFY